MDKHAVLPKLDAVHNGPLGLDRSGCRTGPLLLLRPTQTGPDQTGPDRGNTSRKLGGFPQLFELTARDRPGTLAGKVQH